VLLCRSAEAIEVKDALDRLLIEPAPDEQTSRAPARRGVVRAGSEALLEQPHRSLGVVSPMCTRRFDGDSLVDVQPLELIRRTNAPMTASPEVSGDVGCQSPLVEQPLALQAIQ
jgi:hypothetical protein